VYDVVLLTLSDSADAGCGVRTPVLACADALTAAGAGANTVIAASDEEIDAVIARLDGPARADGLTWPAPDAKTRLVVAAATTGQLRAVVRRLVRRYAPPPHRRPDDLSGNRTIPDLPPLGVLPLAPDEGLPALLDLPRDPVAVASAVLAGQTRRLDLLRNDGGSVTLDGALVTGADETGRAVTWRALVEVDDAVLSDGDDRLLGCVVANAPGYAQPGGLPLLTGADPADGQVEVAVALPVVTRAFLGRRRMRIEVRRARGRAAAITPRESALPYVDDGVEGTLGRKRSWWIEPGAWSVYAS
jgi:hypothetical protein